MLAENPHKRYVSNVITPDQFSVNEVFIWPNKKKTYSNALLETILLPKKMKTNSLYLSRRVWGYTAKCSQRI